MASLVGSQLRFAREQRGLSLMDAVHATRIPLQRLQWLEQDNYAAFGSLTYARAFLKIYSRYLGVDAAELLDELPTTRLSGRRAYRHLVTNLGPWITPREHTTTIKPVPNREQGHTSPVFAGLAIFVLLLGGTGYWGHQLAQAKLGSNLAPAQALHSAPLLPAPSSIAEATATTSVQSHTPSTHVSQLSPGS